MTASKKEAKLRKKERKKERKKKISGTIFSKTLNALATCQVIPKVQIYLTKNVVRAHFDGFILKFIQRLQIDHWQEVWIPHTRVKANRNISNIKATKGLVIQPT